MDLPEYYMQNAESYVELFKAHAENLSVLMRTMDDAIINAGLPPVGRSRELFKMVLDLSYQVDRAYKKKHDIKENDLILSTYMTKDELKADMRNIFVEEFHRYIDDFNSSMENYLNSTNAKQNDNDQ
jgi:hypothetical protein